MFLTSDERRYADPSYQPLRIVKWIVNKPIIVAIVSLLVAVALTIVALTQPIQIDKRTHAFRVLSNPVVLQYDSYVAARADSSRLLSEVQAIGDGENPNNRKRGVLRTSEDALQLQAPTERRQSLGNLVFVYEATNSKGEKNLLTESPIETIRAFEKQLLDDPGWKKFCKVITKNSKLTRDGLVSLPPSEWVDQCEPPQSVVNFFFPSLNSSETRKYKLYNVLDFDGNGPLYGINDVKMMMAYSNGAFSWFLDRNFTIWHQRSRVLRSVFNFGAPLPGFNSTEGVEFSLQRQKLASWLVPLMSKWNEASTNQVRVMYVGAEVTDSQVDSVIKYDILLALLSLLLVCGWMYIHIRSVILTAAGMVHILLSIPSGYFVVRIILQDNFVSILMCMVVFIIMGIGCDDIFIMVDAWQQSAAQSKNVLRSLEMRMDWVFRRAVGTMFVTSLTTAAAFLANSFSSLLPIRMFGIFMATIVIMNFLLVITWFPAILILWHRSCDKEGQIEGLEDVSQSQTSVPLEEIVSSPSPVSPRPRTSPGSLASSTSEVTLENLESESVQQPGEEIGNPFPDPHKLSRMDQFFFYSFVPTIDGTNQLIVGVGFMILIASIIISLFLKPHPGKPIFFPAGHQLADIPMLEQTVFPVQAGSYESVSLLWGISGVDRSKANSYNPDDVGKAVWDSKFNLADPDSQQHLIDSFLLALNFTDSKNASLVATPWTTVEELHRCFICGFRSWRYMRNMSFPVQTSDEFWSSLKEYLHGDGSKYNSDLGWSSEETPESQRLLFASLVFRSAINGATATSVQKDQALSSWATLANRLNAMGPMSANAAFPTSEIFMWHITEKNLISTAVIGACVSLGLAFVIMVLCTANVVVSLMAMLAIISVVLALTSFMVLVGWTVGIIESVALTIIVGLSVDYIVHISVAYTHFSRHWFLADKDRREIVQYALAEIGASVFGGALTTSSSVLALFFCTITFFSRFGQFVFISIVLSLGSALIFLVALLLLWGALLLAMAKFFRPFH